MGAAKNSNYQIEQRQSIDDILYRFVKGYYTRGFQDFAQCANFFQLKPEILINYFQDEKRTTYVAHRLGLNPSWLMHGMGIMFATEQLDWYAKLSHTTHWPKNGPTRLKYGAKSAEDLNIRTLQAQLAIYQQHSILRISMQPLLLTYDRLTDREQAAIDAVWDPNGFGRALLCLEEMTKSRTPNTDEGSYRNEHRYQMTIIDVARLGLCLYLDYENNLVDATLLKEARTTLDWHDEFGIYDLMYSKPPVPQSVIESYEAAIHFVSQLIDDIANELSGTPKNPDYPPAMPRGKKGSSPSPS